MFSIPTILIGLAVLALLALLARNRFFPRTYDVDELRDCHKGKIHVHQGGNCKYDEPEVLRTMHQFVPPVDISNLPPQDPRVAALLACVNEDELLQLVGDLSGVRAVYVGEQHLTIKSRSTHGPGLNQALTWIEQWYRGLSAKTTKLTFGRVPYTRRGKKLFNFEARLNAAPTGLVAGLRTLGLMLTGQAAPAKKKVLIFGSHADSTAGNTWEAEAVAPGADDDASGTVGVMKLAEAMVSIAHLIPDDVEIRFLHFTGEEQGLWGSIAYADQCADEGIDIIGMYQLDMIGYCPDKLNRFDFHDNMDQNGSHALTVVLFRAIAQYGLDLKPIDTHNHAVEGRSDHAPFLNHGKKAGLVSERFTPDGFTPYYHTREDTVDKFNPVCYREIVKAMIATACNTIGLKPDRAAKK